MSEPLVMLKNLANSFDEVRKKSAPVLFPIPILYTITIYYAIVFLNSSSPYCFRCCLFFDHQFVICKPHVGSRPQVIGLIGLYVVDEIHELT